MYKKFFKNDTSTILSSNIHLREVRVGDGPASKIKDVSS